MNTIIFRLLKLSTFLVFIGRAYQYLFWDAPYRAILWDQKLMEGIVNLFGVQWQDYASSLVVDYNIQLSIKLTGVFYIIAAICSLFYNNKTQRDLKYIMLIGGVLLIILAFLFCKERFYHSGQFFEYSIQFGLPFTLVFYCSDKFTHKKMVNLLKVLIAFTFVSHGLYALGYYATPGLFIDMVISSLGFSESMASNFLLIVGILDVLLVPLMFIKSTEKAALIYAFVWGTLTAFARIVGNFNSDFILESLNQFVFETIIRLPHGLVPLISYILIKKK